MQPPLQISIPHVDPSEQLWWQPPVGVFSTSHRVVQLERWQSNPQLPPQRVAQLESMHSSAQPPTQARSQVAASQRLWQAPCVQSISHSALSQPSWQRVVQLSEQSSAQLHSSPSPQATTGGAPAVACPPAACPAVPAWGSTPCPAVPASGGV